MTNPTKGQSSLKGDFMSMVRLLYSEFLPKNQTIPTVLLPTRPTESITWWKASRISKQKNALSSIRIMLDHMSIWRPGKNCYSLAGKFWFIWCTQALHFRVSIYFYLYKIFLMKNKINSLEDCKKYLEQSFAEKDKKFWEDGIIKLLENSRK